MKNNLWVISFNFFNKELNISYTESESFRSRGKFLNLLSFLIKKLHNKTSKTQLSKLRMPINKGHSKAVNEVKIMAEEAMKKNDFPSAFLHWTHAIKMVDGAEPTFFDQRCKCFMEAGQFSLAMDDAQHLIDMWFHSIDSKAALLGHVRKAQIFYASQNYAEAVQEFQTSFRMSTDAKEKAAYFDLASKAKKELAKQRTLDAQYPFVGMAVGILVAVAVVVYDYVANGPRSYIGHPFLKVLVVVAVSGSCFFVANFMRDQVVISRRNLLEPPPELFENFMENVAANRSTEEKEEKSKWNYGDPNNGPNETDEWYSCQKYD